MEPTDFHKWLRVRAAGEFSYRTYLLSEGLIDRLGELAGAHRVSISSLVDWLLTRGVLAIDRGELAIPLVPLKARRIDYAPYGEDLDDDG